MINREVCETLHNIQNSFYSVVNILTALEKKNDELATKSNQGWKTQNFMTSL